VQLYLFTWNLHGKTEGLDLALRHLMMRSAEGPWVARLQEVAGGSWVAEARTGSDVLEEFASVRVVGVPDRQPVPRALAILHDPRIEVTPELLT